MSQSTVGEIISFALWMKKQGYRNSTIRACVRVLRSVGRRADLLQPESAKAYLANARLSEGRKAVIVQHLARFYTYKRIPFDKPRYVPVDSLPFVPLESEIDQLISGVGKKTAAYLQLLKETGVEPVGGVVIPANTLAIVASWLGVIGVVGCIGTVVVVAKKRRS